MVAIPQSSLPSQVSSFRLPLGHSGPVLTLRNVAHASLPNPHFASGGCRRLCCFSAGGSYCWARNLWVLIIYFSSQLCCPLWFQGSPQTRQWECFLVFGNFFFKTPFPGWSSVPTSFVSLSVFYIFSYLLSKTMGCFSGCLMSSAGIQKLFCGIHSVFKCSLDEFVEEKVVFPSYSSAILGPPPPPPNSTIS